MMKLTKVSNNFHELEIDGLCVWFSYETPIAVKDENGAVWVRKNDWGKTTGKHINIIKNSYVHTEVSGEVFENML